MEGTLLGPEKGRKSYAEKCYRSLELKVDDRMFQETKPYYGNTYFSSKRKLTPRYMYIYIYIPLICL